MNRGYHRAASLAIAFVTGLVAAPLAHAQSGIDLAWSDCGAYGLAARSFACDTNSGQSVLVGSFVPGVDVPQFNGASGILEILFDTPTISDWWMFNSGGCRYGTPSALSAQFDFTGGVGCLDPWSGAASGGMIYSPGEGGSNVALVRVMASMPASTALVGIEEYYFFKLVLTYSKSTGTGACQGCSDKACIIFDSMQAQVAGGSPPDAWINPIYQDYVLWQPNLLGSCPPEAWHPVATHGTTWGAVKSLYR